MFDDTMIMASSAAMNLPAQSNTFVTSSSLTEVLQSESVRRLFSQPNIVIHAIPRNNAPLAYRLIKPKPEIEKNNGINVECQMKNKPEVSVQVLKTESKKTNEEKSLLPSKSNEKSEILLLPVLRVRKECGHFEPCESLVCDVVFQQYEDHENITPLIAININEDEIDALVMKHCENKKCDALSIDHNKCRKAVIQLIHCDKCIMCDICGTIFKTRKAQVNHKKCRRKTSYNYNTASPSEILKYRMRERELQLLEAARLKRSSDYLDPITGFNRTMQALSKNDELIIIPKMPPIEHKKSRLNFSSMKHFNKQNDCNHKVANNNSSIKTILGNTKLQNSKTDKELTNEKLSSIIMSCKNSMEMKSANNPIERNFLPTKQIKLYDHWNGATVDIKEIPYEQNQQPNSSISLSQPHSQNILNTSLPLNNINLNLTHQPVLNITGLTPNNNFKVVPIAELKSEPSLLHHTQGVPKFCVVPDNLPTLQTYIPSLKVVPIAELKSEPSLLHQVHGMPKFCVVPDTTAMPQIIAKTNVQNVNKEPINVDKKKVLPTILPRLVPKAVQILNSNKFRPLQPALSSTDRNVDIKLGVLIKKQKTRKRPIKKSLKKGKFGCTHCPKRFSSIDYCKIHIAKHENNPGFFCKICEKGFLNKYIMKKHIETEHKVGEVRCEICSCILPTAQELLKHLKSPGIKTKQQCSECCELFDTCYGLDIHMRKQHGFVICTLCKRQITKTKIQRHLMFEHGISKCRSESSLEKLSYPPGNNDIVDEENFNNESVGGTEQIAKNRTVNAVKDESDCIAKSRSVRRRSSKEFFTCTVCERRFENEKQFQIHEANNPMKFTSCPGCGRKFHRKSEYTEHSKTCNWNTAIPMESTIKRRKLNSANEDESTLKSDDSATENSMDQKQKATFESKEYNEINVNEIKNLEKEDENILKTSVETKITNGLKQNSNECLKILKIVKARNNVRSNESCTFLKDDNKKVLHLKAKQIKLDSNQSTVFDHSAAMIYINQDHNYQALQ